MSFGPKKGLFRYFRRPVWVSECLSKIEKTLHIIITRQGLQNEPAHAIVGYSAERVQMAVTWPIIIDILALIDTV